MDNPEKLGTLGTHHTGQRNKNKTQYLLQVTDTLNHITLRRTHFDMSGIRTHNMSGDR